MEFWRLKFGLFLFLILGCATQQSRVNVYQRFLVGVGRSEALDSMDVYQNKNSFRFQYGAKEVTSFELYSENDLLVFKSKSCPNKTIIKLEIGKTVQNQCQSIYPFIGSKITVLDYREFQVDNTNFQVYFLFNDVGDSYLYSSGLFFVKDLGVILITLYEGQYYELKGTNRELLMLIKTDDSFSKMFKIPKLPPVPQIKN